MMAHVTLRALPPTGRRAADGSRTPRFRVCGDALRPTFQDGDVISCDRRTDAVSGMLVVIDYDGDRGETCMIQRLVSDDEHTVTVACPMHADWTELIDRGRIRSIMPIDELRRKVTHGLPVAEPSPIRRTRKRPETTAPPPATMAREYHYEGGQLV